MTGHTGNDGLVLRRRTTVNLGLTDVKLRKGIYKVGLCHLGQADAMIGMKCPRLGIVEKRLVRGLWR